MAATAPEEPLRILFDWRLRERDARFSGRGVARVEPPYRGRLDLFGPRGEGAFTAAIMERELRLPAARQNIPVPPAPLLWSVLGVFLPPDDAELTLARRDGDTLVLGYVGRQQDVWRFTVARRLLTRAEWDHPERGRQTVEVEEVGSPGIPARVVYRDYTAVRELVFTLDQIDEVEPFPADVWVPDTR